MKKNVNKRNITQDLLPKQNHFVIFPSSHCSSHMFLSKHFRLGVNTIWDLLWHLFRHKLIKYYDLVVIPLTLKKAWYTLRVGMGFLSYFAAVRHFGCNEHSVVDGSIPLRFIILIPGQSDGSPPNCWSWFYRFSKLQKLPPKVKCIF